VSASTCGAVDWNEKISGVVTVGGLPLEPPPLGGSPCGISDDPEVGEDCVEPEDISDDESSDVCVESLLELDDGEFAEDVPVLSTVEEPPADEPELVVDVWAKT
jgi:hypothetical protein